MIGLVDFGKIGILVGAAVAVISTLKYAEKAVKIILMIQKCVTPVIEKIEALSADGEIDAKDRKEIALVAIGQIAKSMGLKVGFMERRVISILINVAVGFLPASGLKRPADSAEVATAKLTVPVKEATKQIVAKRRINAH